MSSIHFVAGTTKTLSSEEVEEVTLLSGAVNGTDADGGFVLEEGKPHKVSDRGNVTLVASESSRVNVEAPAPQYPDTTLVDEREEDRAIEESDEDDDEETLESLYEQAQERDIKGRSTMNKAELKQALSGSEADPAGGESDAHDDDPDD